MTCFTKLLLLAGAICITASATAQRVASVPSPDKTLRMTVEFSDQNPTYSVTYKKQALIQKSPLSLEFENGAFGTNLKIGKTILSTVDDNYELVVGKAKKVRNHYNSMIVPMEERKAPFRKINLEVRVFNDGVAFRYDFPEQEGWKAYTLYEENTTFNFVGNPQVTALFLPDYFSSHEGNYTQITCNEIENEKLMDMPALFSFPNGVYMSLTDAALVNYAGMYLTKKNGLMSSELSPLPKQTKVSVRTAIPHVTPWRVMLISDRIGTLMESNIITSLNKPCAIDDLSWLKPGKATFPWWNGTVVPDTTFNQGNNFETQKYYIDFCARNGIEYHSVVEAGGHEWYENDGGGFQPGPNVNITKLVGDLDMKAVCDYAATQGVMVRVWTHFYSLYPKLDEAFAKFEEWGLTGMMVDFMDRDDQEMILMQEEILQKAAKHKLHVQFHGSSRPTGLHRTYPNELTREGTLNYECYKWGLDRMGADHDINMPFTRLLAGAACYHLGGFRAVPATEYKTQNSRPLVTSTRCHMMGMYVVLESYLGMICDEPKAYEGQPGFEFLCQVPTTWDETKIPDAEANTYVITARRSGRDWYVGAINNSTARTRDLSLDFLGDGNYTAEIYTDAPDVDTKPNHLVKNVRTVTAKDRITLLLAASGGAVIRIIAQ